MIKWDDKLVLLKKETTYGTDATATPAANALMTSEFQIEPLAGERQQRNLDRPGQGASPDLYLNKHHRGSFKIEAAGAGAAGDAPAFNAALLAAAFAETLTASTKAQYDPITGDGDSATMDFYWGSDLFKVLGLRAGVGFEYVVGQIPYLTVDWMGLFTAPANTAAPADPDYSSFQDPLPVEDDNAPTLTIHGHAAALESLRIGSGYQLQFRSLVNQEAVRRSRRRIEGTARIEAPTIAVQDYFAVATGHTLGALSLVHGLTAGNIVEVSAPAVQIRDVRPVNVDGDKFLDLDLLFTASEAGDDELAYIFR